MANEEIRLGDDIEKALELLQIKKLVNRLAKKGNCSGCAKRKDLANKYSPYVRKK